jgi:hypothetical protein
MAGFIVFDDGRAFALNNQATDAVVRAIAAEIREPEFREWALAQQSSQLGMGMTRIDIRELSPRCRDEWRSAIRRASAAVAQADPEHLPYGLSETKWSEGNWPEDFRLLAAMLAASEAGEPVDDLNPHMTSALPPTDDREGPGWD